MALAGRAILRADRNSAGEPRLEIRVRDVHRQKDQAAGRSMRAPLALLALLKEGKTNSEVAEIMHMSAPTVSRKILAVLAAIGCTRTSAVVWLRALWGYKLLQRPRSVVHLAVESLAEWTPAEEEVVRLCASGLGTSEIAQLRSRNSFTVRKQLHSAVHKAGCVDKFELLAKLPLRPTVAACEQEPSLVPCAHEVETHNSWQYRL